MAPISPAADAVTTHCRLILARGSRCAAVAAALTATLQATAGAQLPAFPGADGAAAFASGGRGGIVYHVTKLNSAIDDPLRNDLGTIRYGLNNANFPAGVPRTIVFDVGGVFNLGRLPQVGWDPNGNGWDAQSRLSIGGTNVTLAGQTAPGTGVIFMGGGLKPQGNNNVIRNITVASGYGLSGWWKPGDPMPGVPGTAGASTDPAQWFPDNVVYDAMDIAGTNLMIDHVSTLYATDETISMNEVANNITVQYSNISQGQNYPQWDAEGGGLTGHALGSLLEAGSTTAQAAISFHHNLYAHQKARVPQMQAGGLGGFYDFRNNVFYNWFGTAGSKSGNTFLNLVNNFYLAGDGGDQPAGRTSPAINQQSGGTSVLGASSTVYRNGNLLDSNKDADANDGVPLTTGGAANPLWMGGVATYAGVTDPANQAFDRVLNYVGANWWTRDGVIDTPDERIINEARTGTGKIMAWADDPWNNDPLEGVEWRALMNTPQSGRPSDWDVEADIGYGVGDGMPSGWELAHGLDPLARDDAGDFDNDGYTNLEEYLNEIAAWPAPNAIVFNAATNSRYAQITNWDANPSAAEVHNWQPSRYDEAQVNSGTAVIDAVGQHAGVLRIATGAADTATVDITGGWLHAETAVVIGGTATSQGTLHLGGGLLRTPTLDKGAQGQFQMDGGTLSADEVLFSFVNAGGTISPGLSAGTTHVAGDLAIQSGTLLMEIGGTAPGLFDELIVDGMLAAGGVLEVTLLGYEPAAGDTFDLLEFGSLTGSFTLDLPLLAAGLAWDSSQLLATGELSVASATNADFNDDGLVNGNDFLIWQRHAGLASSASRADGDADGNGAVDELDLAAWQSQFGAAAAGSVSAAVPEPASGLLSAVFAGALFARFARRTFARKREFRSKSHRRGEAASGR